MIKEVRICPCWQKIILTLKISFVQLLLWLVSTSSGESSPFAGTKACTAWSVKIYGHACVYPIKLHHWSEGHGFGIMRYSLWASNIRLGLETHCEHVGKGDDSSGKGSEPGNTLCSQTRCSSNPYWSGNQKLEPGVPCKIMRGAGHLGIGFTTRRERFVA